ncbi:hypothetical protein A2U01_0005629 [Trifolium medium]|uniref:Uncharacterized protein n=1 Tax=Trifolium medium TaxID=97028 RepID=A0A392MCB4_9FABA|nr:hypothetical protein [Trifolium medium]
MPSSSALLGLTTEKDGATKEEDDIRQHNSKKIKGGDKPFEPGSSLPVSYADIESSVNNADGLSKVKSYKESVLGISGGLSSTEEDKISGSDMEGDWE